MLRLLLLTVTVLSVIACSGPKFERGSDDASIDEAALSTGLDRADLETSLDEWYTDFAASAFVAGSKADDPQRISVLSIENNTTEHISGALRSLITSVETKLVNSGVFVVVANDAQADKAIDKELSKGDAYDQATLAEAGKRLGVRYLIYGDVGDTAEKTKDRRRVQYYLFLKVVEVDTGRLIFQQQIDRTKQLTG
ncbi:MAG: hypothetical protein P8N09_04470 [Planctomycetota bacterium]|nr:hypothetical protein [Planctomycetota bacterium]